MIGILTVIGVLTFANSGMLAYILYVIHENTEEF